MDDCQKIILDCQGGVVFISISSNANWSYMCMKDLLPTTKFILKQINNFNIQHLGAQLRHMRHTKHRTKLVKKLWWQNTWKSEDHGITGNILLLYVQCNRFWSQYISPEKASSKFNWRVLLTESKQLIFNRFCSSRKWFQFGIETRTVPIAAVCPEGVGIEAASFFRERHMPDCSVSQI